MLDSLAPARPGARRFVGLLLLALGMASSPAPAQHAALELRKGDHVCLLGNALAERMQHHGWLETRLQQRLVGQQLMFFDLGFSADELSVQQRTEGFGTWDDYLTRCEADVVLAFFGYNEAFAGAAGLVKFERDLRAFIEHTLQQRYHGDAIPRLALFSSIPQEDLGDPHLPDGSEQNGRLLRYHEVMAKVCRELAVPYIDLYTPMAARYRSAPAPLTINGIHLTDQGNQVLSGVIEAALLGSETPADRLSVELRRAVLAKNKLWFNRYRATDGYNVYGNRSFLKYTNDQTNREVLQREMEILDALTRRHTEQLWTLAAGRPEPLRFEGVPPPIAVPTNKPGPGPAGQHVFLSGEEEIQQMTLGKGLEIQLFASEERFPDLVNPVQMSWDSQGRLWVAVWPTYPHWEPGHPMNDKLLLFEDVNGDGRADRQVTFADDLHNPTGFEFWGGGVFVAAAPDLLFLKDEDGDDRADTRERVLHGLSSADTHHSANSFVFGPDGALYFQEGTFHMSQIETVRGPVRNHNACVWRFEPRSFRVERYIPYNFANPHGHVFDRWGQGFVTDGTGNENYYDLPFSGHVAHPDKHPRYFTFFRQASRPCAGTELLSSTMFPPEFQGNYLVANVIGFRGIYRYQVNDEGSGFSATIQDPIVSSADENFRPSDLEMGPDGALYFLDWHNPIIGHMQHHLRDPSRDHTHGRIYRVSHAGGEVSRNVPLVDLDVAALVELLRSPEDRLRYRVRLELSARDSAEVVAAAQRFAARVESNGDPEAEHHLLEALWLQQQHLAVDAELLERVLRSPEPRARAAATRVVRGIRDLLPDPLSMLRRSAGDEHPRVRLEAVVAASFFASADAVEVLLEVTRHPTDRFLDYAIEETLRTLRPTLQRALRAGELAHLDAHGLEYLAQRLEPGDLAFLPRRPVVLQAMLRRHGLDADERRAVVTELATATHASPTAVLLTALQALEADPGSHLAHVAQDLGSLLQESLGAAPEVSRDEFQRMAQDSRHAVIRRIALASLVTRDGSPRQVFQESSGTRDRLAEFLSAAPLVQGAALRDQVYSLARPLMFAREAGPDMPESTAAAPREGLRVEYFAKPPRNASREAFAEAVPEAASVARTISADVDVIRDSSAFGLRFSGRLLVERAGEYQFALASDDGSRLYLDGRLVIDNDGDHSLAERSAALQLHAGSHELLITYFDSGGNEGLSLRWKGPGVPLEELPASALRPESELRVREAAIRAAASGPGHEVEKFGDAERLFREAVLLDAAVTLVESVPPERWPAAEVGKLLAGMEAGVELWPTAQRTSAAVVATLDLARRLCDRLPDTEQRAVRRRLAGLGPSIQLLKTLPHQMRYDRRELLVKSGQPVAIVFQNNDAMPHNLVITAPGAMEAVGEAAERLADDGSGRRDLFIPDLPDVLWHTGLLYPGESERLEFLAPEQPGEYPFVCTFPGHWRVMNGIVRVVGELPDDFEPPAAVAEDPGSPPVRAFVKMWTLADLEGAFSVAWEENRSPVRGRELFQAVGCVQCHAFGDLGAGRPVNLSQVGTKYQGKELLRQVLEPSANILEGFESYRFDRTRGFPLVGRVVEENDEEVHVNENMLDAADVRVLPKREIRDRKKLQLSLMPTGMLVTLTRDEILDLMAFLQTPVEGNAIRHTGPRIR